MKTSSEVAKFEAALQRMAPEAVLIDYVSVGYPHYKADLIVQVRKDRQLRLQEEYILSAIVHGLRRTDEIRQFLGLEEFVVDQTLAHLFQRDLVRRDESGCLDATKIGRESLDQHLISDVSVEPLEVYIDALTGEVYARYSYRLDRDLSPQYKLDRLKPRPRLIEDFVQYFEQLQHILRANEKHIDLIGIDEVCSKVSVDYHQLDLVKYKASAESDNLLYELFSRERIDTRFKEKIDKLQSCGIHVLDRFLQEDFADLVEQGNYKEDKQPITGLSLDALNRAEASKRILESLEAKKEQGQITTKEQQHLEVARDEWNQTRNTLRAHSVVEIVHTAQIRDYLHIAFKDAQENLLIVCPWITNSVVTEIFLKHLRDALKRNISVKVVYGYKDRQGRDQNSPEALDKLYKLSGKFENLSVVRVKNTHSKILACDLQFGIVSSFNHLSFRGDDSRTYRDETGTLIRDVGAIEDLYKHAEWLEKTMPA